MKEKNFKVTETLFEVTKIMDDRTAGKFFKSICEYAFTGREYVGKNVTIKSNFTLVKQILDGQAKNVEYGKLGAQKSKDFRHKRDTLRAMKKAVIGCGIVGGIGDLLGKLDEKNEK